MSDRLAEIQYWLDYGHPPTVVGTRWLIAEVERLRAEKAAAVARNEAACSILRALCDATKPDAAELQGVPEFYRRVESVRAFALAVLDGIDGTAPGEHVAESEKP